MSTTRKSPPFSVSPPQTRERSPREGGITEADGGDEAEGDFNQPEGERRSTIMGAEARAGEPSNSRRAAVCAA